MMPSYTRHYSVADQVLIDLSRFIDENYHKDLPNSLIIAEAFIMKYQEYGRRYGLSMINYTVENLIKSKSDNQCLFDSALTGS